MVFKKKYNIYNIPFLNASNNITYQIVKDSFTETWFFTCNKLVILYISKNAIDDFYNTWMFSRIYKFVIYQDLEYYIVFCISHTSDQIRNYLDFLVNNNHNPKYLIFSCFLLNNNKTNSSHDLEFVKYNEKMILNESAPVGFVVLNNNYKIYCLKYIFDDTFNNNSAGQRPRRATFGLSIRVSIRSTRTTRPMPRC